MTTKLPSLIDKPMWPMSLAQVWMVTQLTFLSIFYNLIEFSITKTIQILIFLTLKV
jgi:hypothetical protein